MLRHKITKEEHDIWYHLLADQASMEKHNWELRLFHWPDDVLEAIAFDTENYPKRMRQRATYYLNSGKGLHKNRITQQRAAMINYTLFQLEGVKSNVVREGYKLAKMLQSPLATDKERIFLIDAIRKLSTIERDTKDAISLVRGFNLSKTGKAPKPKPVDSDFNWNF